MAKNVFDTSTGIQNTLTLPKYERRKIIIAEGLEFHHSDIPKHSVIGFLKANLKELKIKSDNPQKAEYVNDDQKVIYSLETVHKKSEFKKALETEGIIVIYAGHSRYGRGACFDTYSGQIPVEGDQWENGGSENGLFRLGYDYVPIPLSDIKKHKYMFAPVPASGENVVISKKEPFNIEKVFRSKTLQIFTLPEEMRKYVLTDYSSPKHQYYGYYKREGKHNVQYYLLNAGWKDTQSPQYELSTTEMKCRTFCHFGCSSRDHFWEVIRRPAYKAWVRPKPPVNRFAYFTTLPGVVWHYWTFFLLTYKAECNPENSEKHWWESHEFAKNRTNAYLKSLKRSIRVY